MTRIYLDNQATTPLDPRVLEAMTPYLTDRFGNASSKDHSYGWEAEEAVKVAREQTAALIDAEPGEIVFTSGATESNNLALKGTVDYLRSKGNHIVTATTEHKAVLDPCEALEKEGHCVVTRLSVDQRGLIDLDQLSSAITDKTILLSIMAANNEIGVLQPTAEIGRIAKERGVLFHTDAAQAVGKETIDVRAMGIDLLSLSAHKLYGPKGVGALYVRKSHPRVRLSPLIHGGGQEGGLRSGTLNVPGIVGLGKACELCRIEMAAERERIRGLRDQLWNGLHKGIDGIALNGHPTLRLAGNLNVSFPGVAGEALLMSIREIALSSGAACASEHPEPSHVLRALGREEPLIRSSLRFGIGRFNTPEEIATAVEKVATAVRELRIKYRSFVS